MTQHFRLDGVEYDVSDLSERGQTLVDRLVFVRTQIIELSNQAALLSKAKNAYIAVSYTHLTLPTKRIV